MSKKKRKKSSGSFFGGIGRFIGGAFSLTFKLLPLALVIACGGGVFFGVRQALYADSNLTVQKININPAQSLSESQYQRLQSEIYGRNILKVDLKGISASFEKDPAIQNVKMTRRFPSEIGVEVTKRKPVAYVQFTPKGRLGLVSYDGMVLETVEESAAKGIIIEALGIGVSQPQVGQQVRNRGLYQALQFLQAYQHQPLAVKEPVTKVILDPLGNVSIVLGEGPEVRLGRRPMQRLDSLKKIIPFLESEMRKKIDYLDLQYDDVVVKQKKGVK